MPCQTAVKHRIGEFPSQSCGPVIDQFVNGLISLCKLVEFNHSHASFFSQLSEQSAGGYYLISHFLQFFAYGSLTASQITGHCNIHNNYSPEIYDLWLIIYD